MKCGPPTIVLSRAPVATNALLERKGAKVALLTTEGHRDVIEMREGLKGDRYNLRIRVLGDVAYAQSSMPNSASQKPSKNTKGENAAETHTAPITIGSPTRS